MLKSFASDRSLRALIRIVLTVMGRIWVIQEPHIERHDQGWYNWNFHN